MAEGKVYGLYTYLQDCSDETHPTPPENIFTDICLYQNDILQALYQQVHPEQYCNCG